MASFSRQYRASCSRASLTCASSAVKSTVSASTPAILQCYRHTARSTLTDILPRHTTQRTLTHKTRHDPSSTPFQLLEKASFSYDCHVMIGLLWAIIDEGDGLTILEKETNWWNVFRCKENLYSHLLSAAEFVLMFLDRKSLKCFSCSALLGKPRCSAATSGVTSKKKHFARKHIFFMFETSNLFLKTICAQIYIYNRPSWPTGLNSSPHMSKIHYNNHLRHRFSQNRGV